MKYLRNLRGGQRTALYLLEKKTGGAASISILEVLEITLTIGPITSSSNHTLEQKWLRMCSSYINVSHLDAATSIVIGHIAMVSKWD